LVDEDDVRDAECGGDGRSEEGAYVIAGRQLRRGRGREREEGPLGGDERHKSRYDEL